MRFRFTDDQRSFREEIIEALHRELPADWERDYEGLERDLAFQRALFRRLGERSLIAPGWPVEHDGRGYGHLKQAIYNETMAYHQVPIGSLSVAVELAGPVLMMHGGPEQKTHLQRIARGEEVWMQCFTEPASGSDLASLQTTAILQGDSFVVNGKKVGSGESKGAQWGTLLARTDPEQPGREGISFLIFAIDSPGITFDPRVDMAGGLPFNHVIFEDVRIPRANLVGELNQGWTLAQTTLDFERSSIAGVAMSQRLLERMVAFCQERAVDGALVRHRLAGLRAELEAARLLAYRVAWLQERGERPSYEASVSKLYGSELAQRVARAATEILGPYGGLLPGSPRTELGGDPAQRYLSTVAATIGAGTSEIQRNLIAMRGLGLPRPA